MNKDYIIKKLKGGEPLEVSNTDKRMLDIMKWLEYMVTKEIKDNPQGGYKIIYRLKK